MLFLQDDNLKTDIMGRTSTYLNFPRNTEEAFNFYKNVFGGDFVDGKINRFRDIPPQEGMPRVAEADKDLVMHIALPILGGHLLMGTDAPESMGFTVNKGNNVYISLHPDSREEADRLFNSLAEGGKVEMPMQDMFWGDYYGSLTDKFGILWMVNFGAM
jgi:PhnB protein